MQNMVPERGDTGVSIPITFDVQGYRESISLRKMVLGLFIIILGIVAMILLFCFAESKYQPWLPLLAFFGTFYFVRFIFLKEFKYKKMRRKLIEQGYQFSHKIFWGIYSINEYYPYICKMANGNSAIFVAFDKDVIIGRDVDADYDHYEAIAEAYDTMIKKDIWCIHIDYADTVGKDDRLDSLFKNLTETENKDLKNETIRLYDYVQSFMYKVYADYDVYAFFYRGRDEAFWDDLQPVISAFSEANYVRSRVLSREEIGDLCISLMNLNDFSTARAIEQVFLSTARAGNAIKVIWTEKDGVRKQENRRREEIEAERRVKLAEEAMREQSRRKRKKRRGKKNKENLNENLNIFDETDDSEFIANIDNITMDVAVETIGDNSTADIDKKTVMSEDGVSGDNNSVDMSTNLNIFDDDE